MATELKRIVVRRDTTANWTAENPILASGEIGLDTTTGYVRFGDGATAFLSLSVWGAYTDAEKTKLDGIEAGADVTDTANVTAAGALMDSEVTNLAAVKAFDPADYATAAQGAKADSAQQPPAEGAFVSGDKTKLDGIETGATADQSNAEIETAYNAQVAQVSAGEKTAGTETAIRRFAPKDVADMVGTHRLGRFTSTGQTITSAGLLTLAHGLGAVPGSVRLRLKCTSAEYNYSVNDVIYVDALGTSTTANRVNAVYADATNVYVRFSSQASCFASANKSTGDAVLLTNASWSLYIEAYE